MTMRYLSLKEKFDTVISKNTFYFYNEEFRTFLLVKGKGIQGIGSPNKNSKDENENRRLS